MTKLKVSIITPSFNQDKFLNETIASVTNQDYPNIEYIIMDGGSSDGSINIIKKHSKNIDYWVSKRDKGQSNAINKGMKFCSGDIIAWLNSDDYYKSPQAISRIAQTFADNPSAQVVAGDCEVMNLDNETSLVKNGSILSIEKLLTTGKVPGQPSVFFRRQVLDTVGYLREDLEYVLDWEFWLRISINIQADKILFIDDIISTARHYKNNKTHVGYNSFAESGLSLNGHEKRKILNKLFSHSSFNIKLKHKPKYYCSIFYTEQAFEQFKSGNSQFARMLTMKAFKLSPKIIFNPLFSKNLLLFIFGYNFLRKLKNLIHNNQSLK